MATGQQDQEQDQAREQAYSREAQARRSQQGQPTYPLDKEPTRRGQPIPERNPVWQGQAVPPGEETSVEPDLGHQSWHDAVASKAHDIADHMADKRQAGHVVVDGEGQVSYERQEIASERQETADGGTEPADHTASPQGETVTDDRPEQAESRYADYPEDGTKDEVVAWVNDDPTRAEYAMHRENTGRRRSTLVTELQQVRNRDRTQTDQG